MVDDAVHRAGEMTAPQLTRHVRATLIALNPDVAEKRRVAERERRGVFLDLAPDAMARLIAYLPAAEATAAFTAIDALAGHAAVDGDDRTVDQRRADAFSRRVHLRSWTGRPPRTAPRCRPGTGNASRSRSPSPPPPCSGWTTPPGTSARTGRSPRRSPASSPRTPPGAAS